MLDRRYGGNFCKVVGLGGERGENLALSHCNGNCFLAVGDWSGDISLNLVSADTFRKIRDAASEAVIALDLEKESASVTFTREELTRLRQILCREVEKAGNSPCLERAMIAKISTAERPD